MRHWVTNHRILAISVLAVLVAMVVGLTATGGCVGAWSLFAQRHEQQQQQQQQPPLFFNVTIIKHLNASSDSPIDGKLGDELAANLKDALADSLVPSCSVNVSVYYVRNSFSSFFTIFSCFFFFALFVFFC
jgi:hypothetical protein